MDDVTFSNCVKQHLSKYFSLPENQVEEMLPEFRRTLCAHMKNLKNAQATKGLAELERAAHAIKGAFLSLGLTDCADLALQIEDGAANGKSFEYSSLIAEIDNAIGEVLLDE
ncbi:MAG: Hpt domain-containing protein [Desulfopila sp.]